MRKLFLLIGLCLTLNGNSQIFTLIDSMQLSEANIWGVVFNAGDSLGITTTQSINGMPHIYLRKVDYNNISQQSTLKQLTFNADFNGLTNLTDHKTIVVNNEIYVSFSTIGDQDLFLFKTDINGNRIDSIKTVVSGSPDPTNDMVLVSDNNSIYVLHFDPPFQHHVYQYDLNLNQIGNVFSTTTLNHNNIGACVFLNNEFHLYTGGGFGLNTSLLHTTWQPDWQPVNSSIILPSNNGDGNWFSTGAVFDSLNNRWYIAMSHLEANGTLGQEHIDLLAFDINFNLLERIHVTNSGYYRPHLALHNNNLYLSYDASGTGVYMHQYSISNTTDISNTTQNKHISIFPNPAKNYLQVNDIPLNTEIIIFDITGNIVDHQKITTSKINISHLPNGIYFLKANDKVVKFSKI